MDVVNYEIMLPNGTQPWISTELFSHPPSVSNNEQQQDLETLTLFCYYIKITNIPEITNCQLNVMPEEHASSKVLN